MRYEKLNIEITNEHYFDNIIQYNDVIELYSNNILKFKVYRNSGVCAYNSSTVDVYGSSRVDAYDKSIVNAYVESIVNAYCGSIIYARDSSTIRAHGSSTVYAYENSKVYAHHNSTVYAEDTSTVYADDNSKVYAHNSSTVAAYDSSKVVAYDNSIVFAKDNSTVDAYEFACVYIKSYDVKINTINHFGAIIKQVFKIEKDTIVYKKLKDNKIATLKLLKGQTFQSEYFNKCRTDRAIVVEITNTKNTEKYENGVSSYDENFIYEVGKEVIADKYDKNIEECSNGIHFFLTREKAEEYKL